MTPRVLMVAYNFPPVGGVGMLRTLKYATYLPNFGWEPVVLTARDPGAGFLDEAALRDLPSSLAVERAFSPEPAKLRRLLGRAVRNAEGGDDDAGTRAAGTTARHVRGNRRSAGTGYPGAG